MSKQHKAITEPIECKVCGTICKNGRSLSAHLQMKHKLSGKEYAIKYLCGGVEPVCLECGDEVRYFSFAFKRYCKKHSRLAEIAGGKRGGTAEAWNKGQTKETDDRLMKYSEKYSGDGNPFYGKRHTPESIAKMKNSCRLTTEEFLERVTKRCSLDKDNIEKHHEFVCQTTYSEYESRQHQYLQLKCLKCGEESEKTLQAVELGSLCYTCHPISKYSKTEKEIAEFIESAGLSVTRNSRSIITPKELDIYVPSRGFAFEFHGLYWHDAEKIGKTLHREKFEMCEEKNISLMQVFSDEWAEKRNIVKSMILHRLGKTKSRIGGRECKVAFIDPRQQKIFFDENHLAGHVSSKVAWGLFHKDELVAAISLRGPMIKGAAGKIIEVARYCPKRNTSVAGGLGKLISVARKWANENHYEKIITYVNLMHGSGSGYLAAGFEYVHATGNFWYTNGRERMSRTKVVADKVNKIPEADVATQSGLWRVYGAGNALYQLPLDKPAEMRHDVSSGGAA